MTQVNRYFKDEEFACSCGKCTGGGIRLQLLTKLIKARYYAGIPFWITSGFRCEAHNKSIGSSKTSSHMKGLAVDISAKSSHQKFVITKALLEAGFKRIGIGKEFIHADTDFEKQEELIWIY